MHFGKKNTLHDIYYYKKRTDKTKQSLAQPTAPEARPEVHQSI